MSGFKRAGTPSEDPLKWKQSRNNQTGALQPTTAQPTTLDNAVSPRAGQPCVEPSLVTLPSFSDTVF